MKLSRWLIVISGTVAVGMLQVAQHHMLYLKGYALGDRVEQAHKQQTEVSWLETRVVRLSSPDRLSSTAQDRHLNLVAWSILTPGQAQLLAGVPQSHESVQLADGRDTTD